MKSKIKYLIRIALLFLPAGVSAQALPAVPIAQLFPQYQSTPYNRRQTNPHTIPPINPYNRSQSNPYKPDELPDIQKRNEAMIAEDIRRYQQIQMEEMQRQADIKMLIDSGFPSQSYQTGTSYYYKAFHEIDSMLQGKKPMNLGRTVFLVENAYYDDSISYADYQDVIKKKIKLCKDKIREEKLDAGNNTIKNLMLFSILTDTMKIRSNGKTAISYPLKYDLNDYKSEKYFDSHFVTKLMRTSIGQCYSMPLYYLILAEELGSEAYWSISPRHTFVKIQDENGVWYNLELTCGAVLSDAHYMNNSYIKAETLQNRIYMEPLDKTNTVAEMLIELARGYYEKYGLDDFYLKCVETAEQYLSNHLNVLICKGFYETRLTLTLVRLIGASNPEMLKAKSLEAYKHYEVMQDLYKQIDELGYEELPESIYANWLEHIEKLKEQSKKEEKNLFLGRKRN